MGKCYRRKLKVNDCTSFRTDNQCSNTINAIVINCHSLKSPLILVNLLIHVYSYTIHNLWIRTMVIFLNICVYI